jgi:hypothetical protein
MPLHKLHIWFFADTQANPEKTKRAISCHRSKIEEQDRLHTDIIILKEKKC